MTRSDILAREAAIDWAIRAHDPAFDDWEALAEWLAEDPDHAVLYDRATIAADEGARAVPVVADRLAPVADIAKARRRLWRWLPLAMAASVVAAVGVGLGLDHSASPVFYAVATPPGGRQALALAGAVRMELNGDTKITLDRKDSRFARLDQGQATFKVVHDPDHPFALHVGDAVVTDVGTLFDVERSGDGTRIAVAEGAVRVTSTAGAVTAAAGSVIALDGNGAIAVQRGQDTREVGAWREGQIDFTDITLTQLALRLHRASGAKITVAPDIAGRRVTGSIVLERKSDAALRDLGAVLAIRVTGNGDSWTWSAPTGALRS